MDQPRFPTHPYLRNRWDRTERQLAFTCTSRTDRNRWRRTTLRKLKQLVGYDTMELADPRPKITEEKNLPGYLQQRIEIETEPGIVMPFYALVPTNFEPPFPTIIAPHGHGSGGKLAVVDDRSHPQVAAAIDLYNYGYGARFAEAGFLTLCPDARGFGERREAADADDLLASSCRWINNMGYPLGQTVTGMWTWDIQRLIDYAESRSDCDSTRIGCAGLSGGGLQTLWATAFDRRIRCAIVSGYMYGYAESLLDLYTNCSCNFVPHLYEYVDMGDIAALIAPRPVLFESGDADPLNGAGGLKNVKAQIDIARRAYRLYDAESKLQHDVFSGVHRWDGANAIPWMKEHLAER